MKLLSFAVPCYNSEAYMERCIESLLPGGEEVEILIIDDGSTDRTAEIADSYEKKYPSICRAIHQENGGHGEAVNAGIRNAAGMFFKVVDSDDRVDSDAYCKILGKLRYLSCGQTRLDMFIANYVYDKQGSRHKKTMRLNFFPRNRLFTWSEVKHIRVGHYMLMHSVIYRTELLRECSLELPKHTFYVDNIYVFKPLPSVHTMYYMDVDFYWYFIGREDQSVNEAVMLKRIDQQIKINKIMIADSDIWKSPYPQCRKYMVNYLEIITVVSSVLLIKAGRKEGIGELFSYMAEQDPGLFEIFRHRFSYFCLYRSGTPGIALTSAGYSALKKIFGFN